ncbi:MULTISPECIES: RNA polymerase sigma factor [unclassified Oceanobacillus]|uniref:RNA polymerase sigma factor n=1 Tax=unclassified Oceanobacillus TaxID=2630292 RepID=UPI0012EC805A|nr:sigma-70 family RNA polymerase sigma factor [Oceanobacillus sp. AG]
MKKEDCKTQDSRMLEYYERLLESFLSHGANYKLVQKALDNPTERNKKEVNNAFKEHCKKVKVIKYTSNLIHFYSIDYDKRINRYKNNSLLILDNPVSYGDSSNSIVGKDLIESTTHKDFDSIYGFTLKDQVGNECLISALEKITSKQLQILELIYLNGLSLQEISSLFKTSPQNISNQHRKALKRLKEILRNQ